MNPSGSSEKRKDQRYPVAATATVTQLDPPFRQSDAQVTNISSNGLLLSMPVQSSLQIGSRVKVRFGTTVVTGDIRHLTLEEPNLMVGIRIDEAKFGK